MKKILSTLLIVWTSFFAFHQTEVLAAGLSEPCCDAGGCCDEDCEEGNCTESDCSNPDCSHPEA